MKMSKRTTKVQDLGRLDQVEADQREETMQSQCHFEETTSDFMSLKREQGAAKAQNKYAKDKNFSVTSKSVYFQRYVLSGCSSINLTILLSFYANLTMITPLHVAGQRMHACQDLAKLELFFCVCGRGAQMNCLQSLTMDIL